MNKTMISSAIRMAVIAVGSFAVAKGFATQDMIDKASNLETITQVVGAFATLWAVVAGLRARTDAAIVTSASKLPGVSEIKVTDPKIASATPANVTVVKSY